MERFVLKEKLIVPPCPAESGEDGNGVFSFIYRGDEVKKIENRFGRENCCLKIFKNHEPFSRDGWWGHSARPKGSKHTEAAKIQNIFAMEELAPRIYALVVIESDGEKYIAQLTDDLGSCIPNKFEQDELINGKMKLVAEKYGIEIFNDGREWNVVNGKYVDFQAFHFKDNYEDLLRGRVVGVANVGKWGPWENYHPIPKLDIGGGRNNNKRVKAMGLDEINFKDKTVLDIGCSEGFFCRYADRRKAKRIVGIDLPGVIKPVEELTYYLGYNNIDYCGYDLTKDVPKLEFDVVFFFSMVQHIGLPEWVLSSAKTLIFEGNGKNEDSSAIEKIEEKFPYVEKIGETYDLGIRPVYCASYGPISNY